MCWNYSGDPNSSPLDHVRFIIGDTQPNAPLLTDPEILFLLQLNSDDPKRAALNAVDKLLAKFALEVDYTIGPERVAASQRFEHLKLLREHLSNELKTTGAPSWDGASGHPSGRPLFNIGMHDNGPMRW